MVREPDFLTARGGMSELIRSFDWSQTSLGPLETWPEALIGTVRIMLAQAFPMLLWWGPDYVQIYNDAYVPIPGGKHPAALGQRGEDCWKETWHVLKPLVDTPFQGGPATWMEDIQLELERHGFLEETHFTIAYSPVPDEASPNGIGGVLATVHEITGQVISQRRVALLRDLAARTADAKSASDACRRAARTLSLLKVDIAFAEIYLADGQDGAPRPAGSAGMAGELPALSSAAARAVEEALRTGEMQRIDLTDCPAIGGGPWSDPPRAAVALPIRNRGLHHAEGCAVFGLSPRLRFDEQYRSFLELVTAQLASAIMNARAFEEEKVRAERLAELDRAKTIFFSNVSHEFRTPLTLLLSPMEEILQRPGETPLSEIADLLAIARRNGLRMQKLVNAVLDFARIEAGRIEASFEPVDLAALTGELAASFRSAIEAAGMRLTVECPPLPKPVYIDRDMWDKIVLNLLSNAFKYTLAGEIRVSLRDSVGSAELAVSDTGSGIPEHELSRVFERFHRVEGTRARSFEGTGIGLSLVSELVRLHGGTVTVESRLGEGSVFRVRVPYGHAHLAPESLGRGKTLAPTDSRPRHYLEEALRWLPSANAEAAGPAVPKADVARILVADDNADMRDYLRRLLGQRYYVELASCGEEALTIALRDPPDLLLADIMMPRMDGIELVRRLRAEKGTSTIPVILLSAAAGEAARIRGFDAGADDYLEKPFSPAELTARIAANLQMARVRREGLERETELRKQTEQARRRANDIIETVSDGFFTLDASLHFTYLNRAAENHLGKSRHDLLERPVGDAFPAIPGSETEAVLRRVAAGDKPATFELRDRARDKWYEGRAFPASGGEVAVCYQDVTQNRRAAEALRRSEQEFRSLANAIPNLAWMAKPDGWIFWYNQRWYEYTGTTPPEMEGWGWQQVHDPAVLPQVMDQWRTSISSGQPFEMTFPLRGADGSFRSFLTRIIPVRDAEGKVVRWFGTNTDITKQKTIEEALRENEERFRSMANSAPVMIWVSSKDKQYTWFNKLWLDFRGRALEEELGQGWIEGVHPEDLDPCVQTYESAFNARARFKLEYRLQRHDGAWRWISNHGVPRFGPQNEFLGYIGSSIDVTDSREAMEALRRANADLQQFAYSASHDLQEPIRNIAIHSELLELRLGEGLDDEGRTFLRYINDGAHRLEALVRDLLTYTQAGSPSESPVDLVDANVVFADVTAALAQSIRTAGAKISCEDLPEVRIHDFHLEQILLNLVSNALKYRSEAPPRIHVSAVRAGNEWRFSVQDNGIGIEPRYREVIFGIFKRLHNSERYSGTGMGLAICQRLVEGYGGRIWVESHGHGSTFCFTLPAPVGVA